MNEECLNKIKNAKALVLSGGGTAVISEVGVLQEIREIRDLNFEAYSGSSAGALLCAMLALNVDIELIKNELMEFNFNNLLDETHWDFDVIDLKRFFTRFGWYKGDVFKKYCYDKIKHFAGKNITFLELFEERGKKLNITSYCISTKKTMYFNYQTTPYMPVSLAVYLSGLYPFVFATGEVPFMDMQIYKNTLIDTIGHDSYLFCDGGLLDNYPFAYLENWYNVENIIGLRIGNEKNTDEPVGKPKNIVSYAISLADVLVSQSQLLHVSKKYWDNTIQVNIGSHKTTDFNVTITDKKDLLRLGKKSWVGWSTN